MAGMNLGLNRVMIGRGVVFNLNCAYANNWGEIWYLQSRVVIIITEYQE